VNFEITIDATSSVTGNTPDDVTLLIPHQANARIMAAVAARMSDAQMKALADYTAGLR